MVNQWGKFEKLYVSFYFRGTNLKFGMSCNSKFDSAVRKVTAFKTSPFVRLGKAGKCAVSGA